MAGSTLVLEQSDSSASVAAGLNMGLQVPDEPPRASAHHPKVCFAEWLKSWSVLITIAGAYI